MNRGIITFSESGTVTMPTAPVCMSMQEIADMLNVFGCYVRLSRGYSRRASCESMIYAAM